jgi:hypothetical protein
MNVGRGKGRAVLAALTWGVLLAVPSTALAGECDPIMPSSSVTAGMTGTGWTVARGRTPEPFSVEVLGILRNEIGPGRDMIVVQASSPAIDRAGIWFGMSGSPVYVGGQLIGAVAFGFSGASPIAGLTPASDMARVLSYPPMSPRTLAAADAMPSAVRLPADLRQRIAEATGTSVGSVATTMTRLRVPLSVSGLRARGLARVEAWAHKRGLGVLPYSGSSASNTPVSAAATMQPGDNFAAAISYGDVTSAGVGTTTYVCNGRALAFGHPFFFSGATTIGANAADALAVITDPLFGSFKMAAVAETVGRVDQDRLAGIGSTFGEAPATTPVRSSVFAKDLNARRDGATDVVLEEELPFVGFLHLLLNIDSVFDEIGEGSSELSWTITGKREGGAPWELSRSNVFASEFDISATSAEDVLMALDLIGFNPLEEVEFTGVRADATVETTVRQYTITKLLVKTSKRGPYRAREMVRVRPRMLLRFRAILKPFEDGAEQTYDFAFRVPKRMRLAMGMVEVSGSLGGPRICYSEIECEGGTVVKTFDELLKKLGEAPKNNVLGARHRVGERMKVRAKRDWTLEGVVRGFRTIFLVPAGRGGGGPEVAHGGP